MVGVQVTITGLQTRTEHKVKTNKDGVYTTLFTQGDGEYVVAARAMGYKIQRQRVTQPQTGNVFVADIAMSVVASALDTVTVRGDRSRVASNKDDPSIGGDQRDLRRGALFSLDPADLSTLLEGTPGLLMLPGNTGLYSALGASPDQNSLVADGAKLSGARLPSEGIERATANVTDYDASHGGFAGGQTRVVTKSGSNYPEFSLTTNFTDPRLAWQDREALTPISRTESWSGGLSGPIKKNSSFYALSFEMNRNSTPLTSILNLNNSMMEQAGLIRDTIQSVQSVLNTLGVPATTGVIPGRNLTTNGSYLGRFDMNPTETSALTLRFNGGWSRTDGGGIGQSAFPATGTFGDGKNTGIYAGLTSYWGKFLNELVANYAYSDNKNAPYVLFPGGSVLVTSLFTDGRTGLSPITFGGSTSGHNENTSTDVSLQNDLSLLSTDTKHQLKLSTSYSHNSTRSLYVNDPYGSFTYQTIADLQSNHPASYNRTLSAQDRSSTASTAGFSLGDVWRASPAWNFEYGLRLDLAHSGVHIDYNPVVDSVFGRRTDHVPHDIGFTPRFGFSWTQQLKSDQDAAALGTDPNIRRAMRRARSYFDYKQPITVSGGVGGFRGFLQPSQIAGLVDATGLPNTTRQLTCVGDATPIPLWDQYSAGTAVSPEQCLDGTAATAFALNQPAVRVYDPSFRAPLSWRGNVAVGGLSALGWTLQLNSDYSYGVNGQSSIDLNLRRTPIFSLPGEGRPMYVGPDQIVPGTGLIAPAASRIDTAFGSVTNIVSDVKNYATSFTVGLNKRNPLFDKIPLQASYTFNKGSNQTRGIGLDPFTLHWSPSQQPTHQFSASSWFSIKWFAIQAQLRLQSGVAYTPVANVDLNGDGAANDPAFVYDPSTVTDPTLRADLQTLLASSPSARKCLQPQLGQIVGVNSCRTGWQLVPNLNIGFQGFDSHLNPTKTLGWQDKLSFTLVTQNGMSVLLRALHLTQTSFAAAATPMTLDPTLYYVDGFDPTTRQFHYRVNQQFGETRRRPVRGQYPIQPFQVTLRGRLHLGGPPTPLIVESFNLVAPEGQDPYTREQISDHLRLLVANPVTQLLDMRDILFLTDSQITKLEALDTNFARRADSLASPVIDYVAENGRKSTNEEFMKRFSKLQASFAKAMTESVQDAAPILTDKQKQQLPPYLRALVKKGEDRDKDKDKGSDKRDDRDSAKGR